jgi:beta-lactamase class A
MKSLLQPQHRSFLFLGCAVVIALSFVAGSSLHPFSANVSQSADLRLIPVRLGGFKYINPLLYYDSATSTEPAQYLGLKGELAEFIDRNIKNGRVSKVSLYFRDLTKLGWINVNPAEKFSPASLLKVPTMIGVLKYAEAHPEILAKKILYDGSFDLNAAETIKPLKQLQIGDYYTIDELLKALIVYSDNNAAELIHKAISPEVFYWVFTDLDLSVPQASVTTSDFDYMAAKSYASFFRVLYNATYLSKEMSEKALTLLSGTDFPEGIEAGIPENIPTAQKFGERTVVDAGGHVLALELHDCGIVYYPDRPYLLCIMTAGSNFVDLENVISGLSFIAYRGLKNL